METWVLVALLISGDLSANGESACGDISNGAAALHLRFDQDERLSPRELRIAVAEIRNIWGAAGVAVTTGQYGEAAPPGRAIVSIRIVNTEWERDERPVLGWIPRELTKPERSPVVFVSKPAIAKALAAGLVRGKPFGLQPLALRRALIAAAVGRVIAHEVGHYFLRSTEHTQRGLMRPAYRSDELIAPFLRRFQIPAEDRPALSRGVAALAARQCAHANEYSDGMPSR